MNTMEFESIIINASIKAKEDTGYPGLESDLRSFESYWDLRKKYSKEKDEDKINKITITKKYGRRYFTKSKFYPLDADDVDKNTKEMEESIVQGYIIVREVFGLNDKTRSYAERWVKWANENKDKAVGLI